jgi:glycosyltransferase involved in cell wall biosynthesis
MKPLVSILIPAFNAEKWIADTLESAIGQTWERKEIIVVDDGSRDQTLAIARQCASKGVSIVTQENQGASAARNKAFSLSQGDYIQWLDADDLLEADKITRQMEVAEQNGNRRLLLSSAWGQFMYRSNRAEFAPTGLWCDLSPVEWLLRKMGQGFHMQTSTWLVSREVTEAAGPWNTKLLGDDDGEYFCRVLLNSDGTRFVREARVFYRMAGVNSLSYIGRSDRKKEAQLRSMQLHIGYLRSLEESERVRAACVRYLQKYLILFYPERPDIVNQVKQIAADLGGQLGVPQLSWKYAWIRTFFGWSIAKRAQLFLPKIRWSFARSIDMVLFLIQKRKPTTVWGQQQMRSER